MKKLILVLLLVTLFNMEGFAMEKVEIVDYKCPHKGCGGKVEVKEDFDICLKCGEKFSDFIGSGEINSNNNIHIHNWNYYGMATEKFCQPPTNFTGNFIAERYGDIEHYRACGCGQIEINKEGKWVNLKDGFDYIPAKTYIGTNEENDELRKAR